MPIALQNVEWMSLNIFLACLGLIFGLLWVYFKNFYLKLFFLVLWVLFLPNTIYLVTDLQHFNKQFFASRSFAEQIVLYLQYIFLFTFGIFSYLFGMYPLQKLFPIFRKRQNPLFIPAAIMLNFAIAFGVTMGKIERTHSFYLFTQPGRVLQDVIDVFTFLPTLGFTILFAVLCNMIFFSFYAVSVKMLKLK